MPGFGEQTLTQRINTALGRETVVVNNQQIWISRGQTVLIGSNPKDSPHALKGIRFFKVGGLAPKQLSRAAVEISLDQGGEPRIVSRTRNNSVVIHYLELGGAKPWASYDLVSDQEPNETLRRRFGTSFVIDIKTQDNTTIRLNSVGNGMGSGSPGPSQIGYRVEINPKKLDLNQD